LVTPYFTIVNAFFGMLFVGLVFMLPMYLLNVWGTGYIPFNVNKLFDRYGKRFTIRRVLDSRGNLDLEKYRAYSVCIFVFRF